MKFSKYLTENVSTYKNWSFPTNSDMKSDYAEYKKKENTKWKTRASVYQFRFPIFKNFKQFKQEIKQGKVITLTPSFENKIPGTSYCTTIDEVKSMVNTYKRPRDVDRIVKGFYNDEKIPYPIILKGKNGYFRLAGNTRMNIARILEIKVKVLIIDVSK
jgi:hypothetical protein